jgi:transposase
VYDEAMYVDIVPNRNSPPAVLIRENYREDGKVKHRTLANISHLPADRVLAVKRALRGDFDAVVDVESEALMAEQGPQYGALYLLYELARETGLVQVLGNDRCGKLALLLVMAQVIFKGSRAGVVKWAQNQAIFEVLGLGSTTETDFDEDTLYRVLDDVADRRFEIQLGLFRSRQKHASRLFLYDVTSSYLEGICNELGEWGYNRDGKKGKKQIVIGLLTDQDGDPVAVEVFQGNTSDPKTVTAQIELLSKRFKVSEVVFVGDRGMLKSAPIEQLATEHFHYITAITKPQIESLMKQGVLQLGLFDENLGEVEHERIRYVFRRNPVRVKELDDSRTQRINKARDYAEKLSAILETSPRKSVEIAQRNARAKVVQLKIDGFTRVCVHDRRVFVEIDEQALAQLSRLDGVYVLKTDTGPHDLPTEAVHKAYKSLSQVERDFRTMKSGLEIRPVFVRKKSRTMGHVLVVMLALILERELRKRLSHIPMEVSHAIAAMNGWCLIRQSLGPVRVSQLPKPNPIQSTILTAMGIKQPASLCVARKKNRKKKR